MTALERIRHELEAQGRRGRATGDSYRYQCPVPGHGRGRGDLNPSLRVWATHDRAYLRCLCGCDDRDVLAALGLEIRDLFDQPRTQGAARYAGAAWR